MSICLCHFICAFFMRACVIPVHKLGFQGCEFLKFALKKFFFLSGTFWSSNLLSLIVTSLSTLKLKYKLKAFKIYQWPFFLCKWLFSEKWSWHWKSRLLKFWNRCGHGLFKIWREKIHSLSPCCIFNRYRFVFCGL